jgi:hypothetical protein
MMQRFWNKVDKTPGQGHDLVYGYWCWIWTASKDRSGYGFFRFEGKMERAHRVSWYLKHGKWPEKQINHLCCNPSCVNVYHLEDVNHKENMDYMIKLGRHGRIAPRGINHGRVKLTEDQVYRIRTEHRNRNVSQRELAKKYNVSQSHISDIVNRERWKHIA